MIDEKISKMLKQMNRKTQEGKSCGFEKTEVVSIQIADIDLFDVGFRSSNLLGA